MVEEHALAQADQQARLLAGHFAPFISALNRDPDRVPDEFDALRQRLARPEACAVRDELWRAYGYPASKDVPDPDQRHAAPAGRSRRARARQLSYSPAWVGVALVLCTSGLYVAFHRSWPGAAAARVETLRGFVAVGMTLLPAFLYLRFARFRLDPVCDEYVHNLHRLGVDRPRNLPEPPRASEAWERWAADGGHLRASQGENVYERKFRTQYGRWPRTRNRVEAAGAQWYADSLGNLTVVYFCTAVVGAGWAAVVWNLPPGLEPAGPTLPHALQFGFLGAYFYVLSSLLRRFFQNDLRPGAYLAAIVRFVTVLILVGAVHEALEPESVAPALELSLAFLVGMFPEVGMQLIRKVTSALTGKLRGGIEPPMPLRQLDGMDIWTESRLLEVGIEDVQHLATANLVDALLATRVPAQRLLDWVDQALLLVRAGLPGRDNLRDRTIYLSLREIGLRTASDVAYLVEELTFPVATDFDVLLSRMITINVALCNDPNLRLVRNWKDYEQDRRGRRGQYVLAQSD